MIGPFRHAHNILSRLPAANVLILHLLDDLDDILRHAEERPHDATILHWPRRSDCAKGEDVSIFVRGRQLDTAGSECTH